MSTPRSPEIKNRRLSAVSGGAEATMIRAEVKGEDHITAKASPISIARISMPCPAPVSPRPLWISRTGATRHHRAVTRKRAARQATLCKTRKSGSAVDAVLERLGDGHLHHLVGLFLHLLAGGGVAHHALGALAAIDLADARQGHGTAARHFAGDHVDHGVEGRACGFLVTAHFLGQSGDELGFGHWFCHFLVSFNCPSLGPHERDLTL